MAVLILGIILTAIMTIITLITLSGYYTVYNTLEGFSPIFWGLFMFIAPGIAMIWCGYNEYKRLQFLSEKGEPCYAKLHKARAYTGDDYKSSQYYDFEFIVFLPATNEIKIVKTSFTSSYEYVKVGGFIEGKYYDNNLNISNWIEYTDPSTIPVTAIDAINKYAEDYEIHEMNDVIQKTIADDLYLKNKFGANK